MPKYTTGEIAKLCGVSVRTVQYYDSRELLTPSELSQGGRRLYSAEDLNRMKTICFLRDAGLSISTIGQLLREQDPGSVIGDLVQQQKQALLGQISDARRKLEIVEQIDKNIRNAEHFDLDSIGDVARLMQNRGQLKKVRTVLLATAIPVGIAELSSELLWFFQGIWWPFAMYTVLAVPYVVWIFRYHWKHVQYLCPRCHRVFRPGKKEVFFARHTYATRRLTCTCCGYQGFCTETCAAVTAEEKGNNTYAEN